MSGIHAAVWRHEMTLAEPYTIAYGTYDRAVNLFLRLEAGGGASGVGCAAPAPEVTGESVADCESALRAAGDVLAGSSPALDLETRAALHAVLGRAPAAAAAVGVALWDLRARACGLPLCELLGGRRRPVATSVTLGIAGEQETVRRARERVAEGFRALKVKGGRDPDGDAERMIALRSALGHHVELRFDANQGFSVEGTLRFLARATTADLAVLEQPVRAADPEALRELAGRLRALREGGRSHPPVMADESFVHLRQAAWLASTGVADALNIKLMKVGGLGPAAAADDLARAHGMACMISCMDESAQAIAAALHWALTRPNVRWIDLDGHLGLIDDPAAGAVELHEGRLFLPDRPGAGADLRP